MIDRKLLDTLACPLCKTDVILQENKLVCVKCGRRYPIRHGIPVMLIDEAEGGNGGTHAKNTGNPRS